jgi:hypothetical protein
MENSLQSLLRGCAHHCSCRARQQAVSCPPARGAPGNRSAFGAELVRSVWQIRARAAGLKQKAIAQLLGMTPEYVSIGIRAEPPRRPIVAIITAWEALSPAQRVDWLDALGIPRRSMPRWAQQPLSNRVRGLS